MMPLIKLRFPTPDIAHIPTPSRYHQHILPLNEHMKVEGSLKYMGLSMESK